MKISRTVIAAASLLAAASAHASLDWGWSFDTPDLGVVSATQTLYGHATITNRADSTENLDFYKLYHRMGIWAVQQEGTPFSGYDTGFGHGESFPWPTISAVMDGLVLAPGQSRSLDFVWVKPSWGVTDGRYSVQVDLGICPSGHCGLFGSDVADIKSNQLSWTVSSVPEPQSYALMLLGLAVTGWAARRRRSA